MSLADLIFGKDLVEIETIQIDATISETHGKAAEIAQHRVEDGSQISDNIRALPDSLELSGVITNHPLDITDIIAGGDRVKDAYAALSGLIDRGEIFTITTELKTYESMALGSLVVARDAETGEALHFSCSAEQVVTVTASSIEVQAAAPDPVEARGTPSAAQGKKPPTPAPAAVERDVSALRLLGEAAGAF
ncbi:MAG: hypothetical protein JRD89_01450 [Deltaproteobacteria bacterium]|nr:hypothetical protein [Deltaproteobacteria bacterium]